MRKVKEKCLPCIVHDTEGRKLYSIVSYDGESSFTVLGKSKRDAFRRLLLSWGDVQIASNKTEFENFMVDFNINPIDVIV